MNPPALAGYEAALTRAAFIHQQNAGYLCIRGADRRTFLQRQSTNDLNLLAPDRLLATVLTSPSARILDVFMLYEEGPDTVAALSLPGQAARTFQYLKSRIFFMDKVTLEDASAAFAQFDLIGPQAPSVLQGLGLTQVLVENQLLQTALAGIPVTLFQLDGFGYRLVSDSRDVAGVLSTLAGAGVEQLSNESYEVLRVEAGLPAANAELTEDYTPLETGLDRAVSDSKGCYTGQEVIARQLTYDKVTQRLVGLRLNAPASPGERLLSPSEGRSAGKVTSAVTSPRFGPIALGVVRRPYDVPGTRLALSSNPGAPEATVTPLPFSSTNS